MARDVAPGMVFVDFGFIEPGKLAARVALGYDAVAQLHQQLGRVLTSLSEAASKAAQAKKT